MEKLNVVYEDLNNTLTLEALKNVTATHVVTEIVWGANFLMTWESKNENNSNKADMERNLRAQIMKMKIDQGDESIEDNDIRLSLKIYSDILPPNEEIPYDFKSCTAFMKKLPNILQATNGGKGIPLSYTMIPISVFKDGAMAPTYTPQIDIGVTLGMQTMFEEIGIMKQKLNDIVADIDRMDCIAENTAHSIHALQLGLFEFEEKIRNQLGTTLVAVRSGKKKLVDLETLCREYENSDFAIKKLQHQLTAFTTTNDKMMLITALKKQGVIYLGKGDSLEVLLLNNVGRKAFVLHYSSKAKLKCPDRWKSTSNLFWKIVRENGQNLRSKTSFVFFDMDVQSKDSFDNDLKISLFKNDCLVTKDVLVSFSMPKAKSSNKIEPTSQKPNKRIHIEWKCPESSSTCSEKRHCWLCHRCEKNLEYGFDGFFYCNCGRALAKYFRYSCSGLIHGLLYFKFEENVHEELLKSLRLIPETNILILGETGVGKSTWINGFVNYLSFSSLDDAELGEDTCLIPSKFTITNEEYEEIPIYMGKWDSSNETGSASQNENKSTGESATQSSKSYVFSRGGKTVRIIDTPGIGDTRGIDQDKKNFQNILNHLSYLDEIHGICILLKPNSARLTTMFRFCIKELLTHLHKDASKNIIFCFTNARSTFYMPGDTLPPLRKLLAENKEVEIPLGKATIYCLDNESVRFLGAVKQGLQFDDKKRENYRASWDTSVQETNRLIQHIEGLTPHKIRNTLSLNETRRIIVAMTGPIAQIGKNIDTNILAVENQKIEIENCEKQKKELIHQLYVPVIDLEPEALEKPRTVCTSANCIKTYTVNGKTKTDYTTWCHDECYLENIVVNQYPNPELRNCYAFFNEHSPKIQQETCRKCKCKWEKHMHIDYVCKQVELKIVDENVKRLIDGTIDIVQAKQIAINNLEKQINELNAEKQTVVGASARFAHFLRANAITPYNDALAEYLKMLIEQEKEQVTLGVDKSGLESLIKMLREYEYEVSILTAAMKTNLDKSEYLSAEGVNGLVNDLYKLRINGKHFVKLMDIINNTSQRHERYNEVRYIPPSTIKSVNQVKNILQRKFEDIMRWLPWSPYSKKHVARKGGNSFKMSATKKLNDATEVRLNNVTNYTGQSSHETKQSAIEAVPSQLSNLAINQSAIEEVPNQSSEEGCDLSLEDCNQSSEEDGIVALEDFNQSSEEDGIIALEDFNQSSEEDGIVAVEDFNQSSAEDGIVTLEDFNQSSEEDDIQ